MVRKASAETSALRGVYITRCLRVATSVEVCVAAVGVRKIVVGMHKTADVTTIHIFHFFTNYMIISVVSCLRTRLHGSSFPAHNLSLRDVRQIAGSRLPIRRFAYAGREPP